MTPPIRHETPDPRLTAGCWVTSKRFGRAVLISLEEGWYRIRYRAEHLATRSTIWVLHGEGHVTFLRPADEESLHVLGLEGPFGLGPDRSDPRMP